MISLLTFSALTFGQQGSLPIQFVPKAQFAFDRNVALMESGAGLASEIVLVNDETVSNEVLDAVSKHKDFVRVAELLRVDVSGSVIVWDSAGKLIRDGGIEIPKNIVKLEPGQVYIVLEMPYSVGVPLSAKDKPTIQCNISASKVGRSFAGTDNHFYSIQKVGVPLFKFANIRISVQVRSFVDTFRADAENSKSVGGVGYKVKGLMPDRGDKLEHFEVIQSGFPGMDSFSVYGLYDWDRYVKEVGPVRNRAELVAGRAVKPDSSAPATEDVRIDFAGKRPAKYLSSFAVIRSSNMRGFFQHIAMEPIR